MRFFRVFNQILFRNKYCRNGKRAKKKRVNLEYYDTEVNLGDMLSPVICEWVLDNADIQCHKQINSTKHLMAVGSILGGSGLFDATVWGSGIKSLDQIVSLSKRKYFQKLDVRCVRGPITREVLRSCGYMCPEKYGDPAVLMPLIYKPEIKKNNKYGLILHFRHSTDVPSGIMNLNIRTSDYKSFINEMLSCEKIISSSLHGIILAEAYGIPAIFLCEGRDGEILKYYDWYYSTGRKKFNMAYSIEEAMNMHSESVPDFTNMQKTLMDEFPYDLWEE